jgi:hypothetical protein
MYFDHPRTAAFILGSLEMGSQEMSVGFGVFFGFRGQSLR